MLAAGALMRVRQTMTNSTIALTLTLAVALFAAGTIASGLALAAPPQRASLIQIEQEVMCAVCKTPLSVANGPQADAERDFIRGLIAKGKTDQQIKDALVVQYGDRVLALPRGHGFNLAVYLVPLAVVAVALALLAIALPRWRHRTRALAATGPGPAGPALSDEDTRRLDDDLARYDT
jgi:cytochrome c-type biogenesis protein CcmH/NrfF